MYHAVHEEIHWKDLNNVYFMEKANSDVLPLSASDNFYNPLSGLLQKSSGLDPWIHVQTRIEGRGFHRKIELKCINADKNIPSDECSLLVLQHLPDTVYMDLDEMRLTMDAYCY